MDSLQFRLALLALLLPPAAPARPIVIDHKAVACVVAEKFPRLEARFDPAEHVARARVVFRAEGGVHWYSVEMRPEAGSYWGLLPKPKKTTKRINYYIEIVDTDFGAGRTVDYAPEVMAGPGACSRRLPAAAAVSAAKVSLGAPEGVAGAPLVPPGFSSDGVVAAGSIGAAGVTTGVAAGGAIAAGVAGTAGGGIGATAIILGGVAVAGVATAAAVAARSANRPPTVAMEVKTAFGLVCPPCEPIVAIRVLEFFAKGTDPDGDPARLSFNWDFGDGVTASGPFATHVYQREGTFEVTLTAKDESGATATAKQVFSARSLTGTWDGVHSSGPQFVLELIQKGSSNVDCILNGTLRGSCHMETEQLFVVVDCGAGTGAFFSGVVNDDITRIRGDGFMPCGTPNGDITLVRR